MTRSKMRTTGIIFACLALIGAVYCGMLAARIPRHAPKPLRPVKVLSLDSSKEMADNFYQYDMRYLDMRGDSCEIMFAKRLEIDSIINGTVDPTR